MTRSEFDTQSGAFSAEIDAELKKGKFSFPTVFDLSLKIKQVADDPNSTLGQIAGLIRIEPVLSARVVQMANSAAFNPHGRRISTITDAVQRVGISNIRVTALVVAMEQLSQENRSDTLRNLARDVWKHSIDVAAWAYAIARHLRVGNPDTALLAGIMADIGQLYMIARVGKYPAIVADLGHFAELVGRWHQSLARSILETMSLPTDILEAMSIGDPYDGSWPPATLGEVLFVAGIAADSDNPFDPLQGEVRSTLMEIAKYQLDAPRFDQLLAAAELERDELLAALKN